LLCLPTLGGCASTRYIEWTEDVQLSDGRTIVVRRTEEYRRVTDPGAGFRTGWLFDKASIVAQVPAPISRTVSWEGNLSPLVLDVQPGDVTYLVCDVATGSGAIRWKVPDDEFYVVFRLFDNEWRRIPLSDLPLAVKPNLLPSGQLLIEHGVPSKSHVDLKLKGQLQLAFPESDRVRTIVRLPSKVKN